MSYGSTDPPALDGPPVFAAPAVPDSFRVPRPRKEPPWWGLGDVLLGVPFVLMFAFFGLVAGLIYVGIDRLEVTLKRPEVETPIAVLAASLIGQQIGQGLWPILVSKWKGLGPVVDWRLKIKAIDPLLGVGTAMITLGGVGVVSTVVARLVGLSDASEAGNAQFLEDAKGSPWVYVLLAGTVVGAPLVEELFFRGLLLRALEKRAGSVVAVVGSTVVFTLVHWTGASLAPMLVLFSSIGVVGLVLAMVTISVGRLWPAIFAHMAFNAVGAAAALGAFESALG